MAASTKNNFKNTGLFKVKELQRHISYRQDAHFEKVFRHKCVSQCEHHMYTIQYVIGQLPHVVP